MDKLFDLLHLGGCKLQRQICPQSLLCPTLNRNGTSCGVSSECIRRYCSIFPKCSPFDNWVFPNPSNAQSVPNARPVSSSSKAFVLSSKHGFSNEGMLSNWRNLGVEDFFFLSFNEWMNISAGPKLRWDRIRGPPPRETFWHTSEELRPPVGSKLRLILEATDDNCNVRRKRGKSGSSWQMDSFFRYLKPNKKIPYLGNWFYTKNSTLGILLVFFQVSRHVFRVIIRNVIAVIIVQCFFPNFSLSCLVFSSRPLFLFSPCFKMSE